MPHTFFQCSCFATGPLPIVIRSCLTDSGSMIVVVDNGPRFETANESKSRATPTNILQRLS